MCLVFVAFQMSADDPVMVGANREEDRKRPSTSPVCVRSGSRRCLIAGADRGPDGTFPEIGTWLGVNDMGMVVAVTNRRDGVLPWKDQVRSRGLLAIDLLGCESPELAAELARDELVRGGFGGCNYLIASRAAAFVVQAPGKQSVSVERLEPGIHAITNLDLDDPDDIRIGFVRERLDPSNFEASARDLCLDERILIRNPDRGTVSSSLILVGEKVRFQQLLGVPVGDCFLATD